MRLIQDCVKDILPTKEEVEEAIKHFKKVMPDKEFQIINGAVGTWEMMPNGQTCFHCPPIYLPDVSV